MVQRGTVVALIALAMGAREATPAVAQDTGGGQSQGAKCSTEAYRAFDFWLGEWEVRGQNGQVAGHNRITSILNGCALKEEWTSARGSTGTSYNAWDQAAGRWHQTWVDDQGLVLLLDGGVTNGKMVMTGQRPTPNGSVVRHRITWEPLEKGAVRQLWESSTDGGTSWKPVFDGTYRRVP